MVCVWAKIVCLRLSYVQSVLNSVVREINPKTTDAITLQFRMSIKKEWKTLFVRKNKEPIEWPCFVLCFKMYYQNCAEESRTI